jgi:hypothetical protein
LVHKKTDFRTRLRRKSASTAPNSSLFQKIDVPHGCEHEAAPWQDAYNPAKDDVKASKQGFHVLLAVCGLVISAGPFSVCLGAVVCTHNLITVNLISP